MTNLFAQRKPLIEILDVPEKVTSVYSMVQHIWEGEDEEPRRESRKNGRVRLATIEEYFLDPVRSYLERFLQDIADNEGQGYWLLAHFGVGKSHLMGVEAILALAGDEVWDVVKGKEDQIKNLGPGARLDRFRKQISSKRIFPIIFTLEGRGGGTENRLVDFILNEACTLFEERTGKALAVAASHHLAEWYLKDGHKDFENSLKGFLANKRLMEPLPKFDGYSGLMSALQDPASVDDAATVLRAFLQNKKYRVETPAEPGELLENAFNHILKSGYDGILVVMDEMSEYMNRTKFANDDEDCLLTLSSVLAKGKRMPVWTIVAAQAAYAKQNKIVGPDRMREELLDHKPERFRNIVINRCRSYKVINEKSRIGDTHHYYMGYKDTIPWVKAVDEEQFQDCFPFPQEAVSVIQAISRKLTGTRSTISFLHSALQNTIESDSQWNELIPLYRVFTELMTYEESKSNSASGTISVKSIFREAAAALESAQKKLGKVEIGTIGKKRGKQRAERIINTLFLYHIAGYGGLAPDQILDAVCDLKGEDGVEIQVAYYESILEEMKTALQGQVRFRDGKYEFVPKETGEFDDVVEQARELLRKDSVVFWSYFDKLLDHAQDTPSPFSAYRGSSLIKKEIPWHGQERVGQVTLRDLSVKGKAPTPDTFSSEHDFIVAMSRRSISDAEARDYLKTDPQSPDPRVVVWVPSQPSSEQKSSLINLLAYLKVIDDYPSSKHAKDAKSSFQLQCETGFDFLKQIYQQGKARTCKKTLAIDWTGGLEGCLERMAGEALDDCYKSAAIDFGKRSFGTNEAVKLINGLVKLGKAVSVSDSLHSAVENFAGPLKLISSADSEKLDPSTAGAYLTIRDFAEGKGSQAQPMSVFYNKFTGWHAEDGSKSWGLTKRMVDVYLLALVEQGKARINLKKGTPIERTNLGDIEFKPETLRSFESVELPRALDDWAIFSPFLEVMAAVANETFGPKYEQMTAHEALSKLREVWVPSEKIDGLISRVSALFRELGQSDPYDALLLFWMGLFQQELSGENDQEVFDSFKALLLSGLEKDSPEEVKAEDLALFTENWKQLQALQLHFDDLALLVRSAGSYARVEVPKGKEYRSLANAIKKLGPLVQRAKELVVDPDRANAELRPVLESVWKEYEGPYLHGIRTINEALSDLRNSIDLTGSSGELRVLTTLSSSLGGAESAYREAKETISVSEQELFESLPDGEDLKKRLKQSATVSTSLGKELKLVDLQDLSDAVRRLSETVMGAPSAALLKVARFLHDDVLREKLKSHANNKLVTGILTQKEPEEISTYLLALEQSQLEELTKALQAILKGVQFVTIRLAEFKPSQNILWGDPEVQKVLGELRRFLKDKAGGKIVRIE